jgi:DNA-directed RNA polymerase I, II, and III subunit RPABC1
MLSKEYPEEYAADKVSVIYIAKDRRVSATIFKDHELTRRDELFFYDELIFNRTHHRLVPEHILLSDEEKKLVLQAHDCRDTQIPRILNDDFIVRYYGGRPGDMFKIKRPSPSSGIYITYRLVK